MSREPTDADKVVMAVREHGLQGAFIDSAEYGKHNRIAQGLLKDHSLKRILFVVEQGTDTWPFDQGPWDVFDLKRNWHRAYARACEVYNESRRRESSMPDLRELRKREEEWEAGGE